MSSCSSAVPPESFLPFEPNQICLVDELYFGQLSSRNS
jgi:hypothetical protein